MENFTSGDVPLCLVRRLTGITAAPLHLSHNTIAVDRLTIHRRWRFRSRDWQLVQAECIPICKPYLCAYQCDLLGGSPFGDFGYYTHHPVSILRCEYDSCKTTNKCGSHNSKKVWVTRDLLGEREQLPHPPRYTFTKPLLFSLSNSCDYIKMLLLRQSISIGGVDNGGTDWSPRCIIRFAWKRCCNCDGCNIHKRHWIEYNCERSSMWAVKANGP